MLEQMKRFLVEEDGQGMAEYGLILLLVAIAVVTTLTALGTEISNVFTEIKDELTN